MRYTTVAKYLGEAGCKLTTTEAEYDAYKEIHRLQTVFGYVCKHGRKYDTTIASYKRRKSYYKDRRDWLCCCAASFAAGGSLEPKTTSVTPQECCSPTSGPADCCGSDETSAEEIAAECDGKHVTSAEEIAQEPGECLEVGRGSADEGEDVDVDDVKPPGGLPPPLRGVVAAKTFPENISPEKVFALPVELVAREPEFCAYYMARRDILLQGAGDALDVGPYTDIVVDWLTSTKNPWTRTYIEERDIHIDGCSITVPRLGLKVAVQTVLVHNLDPKTSAAKYMGMQRPCVVVFCDGGCMVDAWYLIQGKKVFSASLKHAFDPCSSLAGGNVRDDAEYFYFEKHVFESMESIDE